MADAPEVTTVDDPEKIREEMERTRQSLAAKLRTLEDKVTGTAEKAVEAVSETVETVKETVQSSVEAVKETFDLRLQVERNPWLMVGGSAVLGFLGGWLLGGPSPSRAPSDSRRRDASGLTLHYPERAPAAPLTQETEPANGWFHSLAESLEPELAKLKGLAIGTIGGVLRDLISQAVPANMQGQVTELVDRFTTRLGGEPIAGHLLPEQEATPLYQARSRAG
jgi:ElaB/YqjD/DUF883 family membrane-anchored ribosome-binding protein